MASKEGIELLRFVSIFQLKQCFSARHSFELSDAFCLEWIYRTSSDAHKLWISLLI